MAKAFSSTKLTAYPENTTQIFIDKLYCGGSEP